MKPKDKNNQMKTTNVFIRYKRYKLSVDNGKSIKYVSTTHFVLIYPLKSYIATYPSF